MRSQSSQFWRTTIDLDLDLDFSITNADTANSHVPDQSKAVVRTGQPNSRGRINGSDQQQHYSVLDRTEPRYVYQNSKGQRVDMPDELSLNPPLIYELRHRQQRLCNAHHLLRDCPNENCPYDHLSVLTDDEFEALLCLSRSVRCTSGSICDQVCFKGHMCPYGRKCKYGSDCKFVDLHDIDTSQLTRSEWVEASDQW